EDAAPKRSATRTKRVRSRVKSWEAFYCVPWVLSSARRAVRSGCNILYFQYLGNKNNILFWLEADTRLAPSLSEDLSGRSASCIPAAGRRPAAQPVRPRDPESARCAPHQESNR